MQNEKISRGVEVGVGWQIPYTTFTQETVRFASCVRPNVIDLCLNPTYAVNVAKLTLTAVNSVLRKLGVFCFCILI